MTGRQTTNDILNYDWKKNELMTHLYETANDYDYKLKEYSCSFKMLTGFSMECTVLWIKDRI